MNGLSLFSGIGGLDLGLERAGITTIGQVEIDPWCRQVLAKHWPDVPRHDDVRTAADWWQSEERPHVDLVFGGFPCQDISNAGRRAGIGGERSGLWAEFADIVRVLRPRWVLLENVAAILGRGAGRVLGDLAEIGYDAEWDCIPAAAVGAPHLRDRWFALAYPQRGGWVGAYSHHGEHSPARGSERQHPIHVGISSQASSEPHDVADAVRGRRWEGSGQLGGVGAAGRGAEVADAPSAGSPNGDARESGRPKDARRLRSERPRGSGPGSERATEPSLGEYTYGVPAGLDGARLDAHAAQVGSGEALPGVRPADGAETLRRSVGGQGSVPAARVLRPSVHASGLCQRHVAAQLEAETSYPVPWDDLRVVWGYDESARSPHRRELGQRLAVEHPDLVRILSCHAPPPCSACWADGSWEDGLPRVARGVPSRVDRLRGLGNAVVPQVAEHVGRLLIAADERGRAA